jgi:antitoxin component YwqK of YwqJK toxin-antitoxin module
MKKLFALILLFTVSLTNAQDVEPTFEKSEDLVKATYYYEDGSIKEQGFFKDKKLEGRWVSYDKKGKKTMIAHYKAGKKVGKWFAWNDSKLKEINYIDNAIVSVKTWSEDTRLASNK